MKYRDRVRIIGGFYGGVEGELTGEAYFGCLKIKLDDGQEVIEYQDNLMLLD